MLLDIRTFLIMGAAFVVLTGSGVLLITSHMPAHVRASARLWALANACLALSWVLAALRDILPEFSAIFVGNLCYLLAATCIVQSVRRFDGLSFQTHLFASFVLPVILSVLAFRYLIDAYDVRVIIMSASVALLLAYASYQLYVTRPAQLFAASGRCPCALWLAANAAFFAVRVGLTISQGAAPPVLENGPLQTLLLALGLVTMVGLMLSYFLLYAGQVTAELAQQAYQDSLTGLDNRRAFERKVNEAIERARARDVPTTLLLLDVDRFKAINDNWGHAVGDEALCAIGAALKSVLRPHDVIARLGGDEFALLVSGLDDAQLTYLAQRLEDAVASYPFGYPVALKVSVGSARLTPRDSSWTNVLKRADEALYARKRGRYISGASAPTLPSLSL